MPPEILSVLRAYRYRFTSEAGLQAGIAAALAAAEIPFEREVSLSASDRIDFLVGGCGIEVKVDGATAAVLRQLHRYAQHERIRSLVLVTSRSRHRQMPEALNGKPVGVVGLWEAM